MATKPSTKTLKFKLKPLEGYGKRVPIIDSISFKRNCTFFTEKRICPRRTRPYILYFYDRWKTNIPYSHKTFSWMSKQLHIKKNELEKLINCPISKEDYIKLLKERGIAL